MSQKTCGLGPNRAASIISSVASTASSRCSYSASSRTKAKTSPASPGRTGRMATAMAFNASAASHRDLRLDMRMRIVAFEHEILIAEREQILRRRRKPHGGEPARRAGELLARLLEVVRIEMRVAE